MGKYQNNRRRLLKERCLIYLGGKKCFHCKVDYLPFSSYDFHHKFGDKECDISEMISKNLSFRKIKTELNKCIILCKNCHSAHHELKVIHFI